MIKIALSAAFLALSVASPSIAKDQPKTFTHQGVKYSYTVTDTSDSRRIIQGYASPGTPFRLVVSRGRVSGTANGAPVEFKMKDVQIITASAATAAPVTIATR